MATSTMGGSLRLADVRLTPSLPSSQALCIFSLYLDHFCSRAFHGCLLTPSHSQISPERFRKDPWVLLLFPSEQLAFCVNSTH